MKSPWNNWLTSKSRSISRSAGVRSDPSLSDELRQDLAVTRNVVIAGFVIGVVVIYVWHSQEHQSMHVFIFWALACYALGSLTGFLFGIPRVLQKPARVGASQSEPATSTSQTPPSYELIINTNLDDVSDWLTKIIVGVGLVEIRKIPDLIYRLSKFIAGNNPDAPVPFVIAIILYFSVLGFMSGYLTTRMFFERAFRIADLAAEGSSSREVTESEIVKTATQTESTGVDRI
jgi:hypothetical protein